MYMYIISCWDTLYSFLFFYISFYLFECSRKAAILNKPVLLLFCQSGSAFTFDRIGLRVAGDVCEVIKSQQFNN